MPAHVQRLPLEARMLPHRRLHGRVGGEEARRDLALVVQASQRLLLGCGEREQDGRLY